MTGTRRPPHAGCKRLMLQIARGLEHDLGPRQRRALAQHLRRCRRCGALSKDLTRTVSLFRRLGEEPLAPHARARALANVAALLAGGRGAAPKRKEAARSPSPSRPRRVTRRSGSRAPTSER